METQTTETPIPTDPVKAREEYRRLEAKMMSDWGPNDQSPEYKAHINRMHQVRAVAFPPEPAVAPAGPTWRERVQARAARQALDAELMQHPEGSPTAKAILEDKIALEDEWAGKQPPQPKPGEITWQDVDRAPSLQRWSAEHRTELVQRMKLGGVSPQETILVGAAIQDFRELTPRAWERPPAEYDEPTRTKAERALAVLFPSSEEREDLREDGLWNQGGERLVAALVELADRLAKR